MFEHEGVLYARKYGSRRAVWDSVAFMTSGKLQRKDLDLKNGKLISKKRSRKGKERYKLKNPFVALEVSTKPAQKKLLRAGVPSRLE